MQAVKRIEIVSDSVESHKIIKVLEKVGVLNYTVIRNVVGKGVSGTNSGDLDMSMAEFVISRMQWLFMRQVLPNTNSQTGITGIAIVMPVMPVCELV